MNKKKMAESSMSALGPRFTGADKNDDLERAPLRPRGRWQNKIEMCVGLDCDERWLPAPSEAWVDETLSHLRITDGGLMNDRS